MLNIKNIFLLCSVGLLFQPNQVVGDIRTDNVIFSISPPQIAIALTSSLDVECSFNRSGSVSMVSVMSILIAHSNETDPPVFTYIASLNVLEGHAHNIDGDVTKLSGFIDSNGESVLRFSFKDPDVSRAGLYKCEVNGFDAMGKPVTLNRTADVRAVEPDFNSLLAEIRSLKSIIETQDNKINNLYDRIDMSKESMFYVSSYYYGRRYYLNRAGYTFIYSEAQSLCALYGGYLAELDSHEEYIFVKDFIQLYLTPTVMIGATDAEQEGIWVNKHNTTSRPVFDWAPGRPLNHTIDNCQCYRSPSYLLFDCFCEYTLTHVNGSKYICEVPEI